jgi:hypothetical protein
MHGHPCICLSLSRLALRPYTIRRAGEPGARYNRAPPSARQTRRAAALSGLSAIGGDTASDRITPLPRAVLPLAGSAAAPAFFRPFLPAARSGAHSTARRHK